VNPIIVRVSLSDAVYFSFASFFVFWLASLLYQSLEKTIGKLNLGVVLIIVLSLILIIFFLAIANIVLAEHEKHVKLRDRVIGIFIFIASSAIILGFLGFLFWFEV
jgi:hypothetical protein